MLHTFLKSFISMLQWFLVCVYFQALFPNIWFLSQERVPNPAATLVCCKMSTGTSKNRYKIGLPIQFHLGDFY